MALFCSNYHCYTHDFYSVFFNFKICHQAIIVLLSTSEIKYILFHFHHAVSLTSFSYSRINQKLILSMHAFDMLESHFIP